MASRVARLQRVLESEKLDGLVVSGAANLRYLCGYTGSNGMMVVTRTRATFFTDFRYQEQIRTEVRGCAKRVLERDLYASFPVEAAKRLRRLGVEQDHLSVARLRLIRKQVRGPRLVAVRDIVRELRRTKEPAEVRLIERAQQVTDRVFAAVLGMVEPGVSEKDIALEIECRFRQAGEVAFPSIVASGPNSAKPHAGYSTRRLRRGDALTLDIGCRLSGYCSDMTRTVFVGRPCDDLRQMYEAVLEAQRRSLAAVRPGATARAVDAACRDYLTGLGFGHYFRHSTGHGVGIEVHELPGLAGTSMHVLQPGDVVTVEPGVYVPGLGGIRIEDMVLVTKTGCRNLTKSPKRMLVL
ncbi:aminopeptidase P family protein [candidate division WOR-3 bacterium]|nr:aminopeptidase P family protein [candidate division WOR-3 bacterium]